MASSITFVLLTKQDIYSHNVHITTITKNYDIPSLFFSREAKVHVIITRRDLIEMFYLKCLVLPAITITNLPTSRFF